MPKIHELNSKTLTDPAYVAADDGEDTYKVDLKDLLDNVTPALDIHVEGTSLIINTSIEDGNEVSY